MPLLEELEEVELPLLAELEEAQPVRPVTRLALWLHEAMSEETRTACSAGTLCAVAVLGCLTGTDGADAIGDGNARGAVVVAVAAVVV